MTKNKEYKQRKRYATWSNYRLVSRIIELEKIKDEMKEELDGAYKKLLKV